MKNSWRISLIIGIIVLLGTTITSIITFNSYSKIVKTSARGISELSTMGVYSEINSELTKPIYVSMTMAHDSFVKDWIAREDVTNQDEIVTYLDGVYQKYKYNSIFLVSTNSSNYYHYNGLNKTVSPTDNHDVWYYDFLALEDDYEIDVDVDEVTGVLTIFINVKIYDDSNQVTAVVGVGLEMNYVKDLLTEFEDNYELTVYLTNGTGLIQSSSDLDEIEIVNMFNIFGEQVTNEILSSQDELVTIEKNNGSQYIISKYIDELDWYLIVTKDTNILAHFFLDYLYITIALVLIVVFIVSNIVHITIKNYQEKIFSLAKTDYLTLLLNRRGFDKEIEDFDSSIKEALIFILDIDRFKLINDQYGHAEGDVVLRHLAKLLNEEVKKYGKLSRWGGDEFTGFLIGEQPVLEEVIKTILTIVQEDSYLHTKNISISIGYTYTDFSDTLDEVLIKADKALYEAKKQENNAAIQYKKAIL